MHDITVVAPYIATAASSASFACCCHQVDIGGLGQGADGRSIYEEGLQIPPMRLVAQGKINEELLELACGNVRTPFELRGDLMSYVTANESASRQLLGMLDEFGLEDLVAPGNTILERSRRAVEEALAALPRGTWRHAITIDGYDHPIELRAALTIGERDILVDYAGSAGASAFGINVVLNYCLAYTAFALKCVVAPEVPNNAGSLAPLRVAAPEAASSMCSDRGRCPRATWSARCCPTWSSAACSKRSLGTCRRKERAAPGPSSFAAARTRPDPARRSSTRCSSTAAARGRGRHATGFRPPLSRAGSRQCRWKWSSTEPPS